MAPVLTIGNRLADLTLAADWLAAQGAALSLPSATLAAMRLCLEETLANLVAHAYDDGQEHAIRVAITAGNGEVSLGVSDDGRPFDPTTAPEPANNDGIEAATIGGRGLRLIRAYADRLDYARRDGRNHFVMGFRITPGRSGPDR